MTRKRKPQGEPQYEKIISTIRRLGPERLGLMTSWAWYDDPKRLAFTLSRYKFVAKMLSGHKQVLEVGCADAFGTRIVCQEVGELTAVDFDPAFVEDANARMSSKWPFTCFSHDMIAGPVPGQFDGVFALDVLEHIAPKKERTFLDNLAASLAPHGVVIIGMPSLESQAYASDVSRAGHVNCKSMPDLKRTMEKYFFNVFMFSMNDEVLHIGYHKMAHYLIALCCDKKPLNNELS
jgi:2-polyprenyl-3-methyl-5-hydroxy-6-metoxy-1,4-benzoquinol methylase